jgi:hypothetical protein
MKKFIQAVFIIVIFSCNSQSSTIKNISFIKTFEGEIGGKYQIMLKIKVDEGNVEGDCFYRSSSEKLKIKGSIDKLRDIILNEYDAEGNQTGVFKGKLIGDSKLSGTWSKADGGKQKDFTLIESNSNFEEASIAKERKTKGEIEIKITDESSSTSKQYTKSELYGNWFTPHYAVRKLKFNIDDTCIFDEGDGKERKGKYEFKDNTVHIVITNQPDKFLKISGGGKYSYTISGGEESFCKVWEESH